MKVQEYELWFTLESQFSVKINAENFEQAKELVHGSPTPATCITDAEGNECEPHWHQSDVGRVEDLNEEITAEEWFGRRDAAAIERLSDALVNEHWDNIDELAVIVHRLMKEEQK